MLDAQGEENAIDWARVVAVFGVVLVRSGVVLSTDEEVAAWVAREHGGEESAVMERRVGR